MKPKLATTLKGYSWPLFLGDAVAGITVALVALPLSIAIAIASGATPKAGLVTAIIGGLIVSLLGGSRVQIGGPTGAFIVVVAGVIAQFGYDGLLLATLLAGGILLLAAVVKAGRFIALVPEAVIEGFTVGIALIIAVSQIKDLLGLCAHVPADLVHGLPALWAARDQLNLTALVVGVASIVGIALLRHRIPWFPGSLLVIGIASSVVAWLSLPVDTIFSRFGELPSGLPAPSMPHFSIARISELLPSAFLIAFLAAVESLLSAIVADRMIGGSYRSGAELLAQGTANIVSPLFGGASGDRSHRKDRDERSRRRTDAGRRNRACSYDPVYSARCRFGRGISGHASLGRSPYRHCMADERARPVARAHEAAPE